MGVIVSQKGVKYSTRQRTTCLRFGGIFNGDFTGKITVECLGERTVKISRGLAKLRAPF